MSATVVCKDLPNFCMRKRSKYTPKIGCYLTCTKRSLLLVLQNVFRGKIDLTISGLISDQIMPLSPSSISKYFHKLVFSKYIVLLTLFRKCSREEIFFIILLLLEYISNKEETTPLTVRMNQHTKPDSSSHLILKFSGGSKFKEELHHIIVALLCSKEQSSCT